MYISRLWQDLWWWHQTSQRLSGKSFVFQVSTSWSAIFVHSLPGTTGVILIRSKRVINVIIAGQRRWAFPLRSNSMHPHRSLRSRLLNRIWIERTQMFTSRAKTDQITAKIVTKPDSSLDSGRCERIFSLLPRLTRYYWSWASIGWSCTETNSSTTEVIFASFEEVDWVVLCS